MNRSRILHVVERDGGLAKILGTLLAAHGLRIQSWSDSRELLAKFDRIRAACVFVEAHAPSLSAAELRSQLRLRGVEVPVIQFDGRTAAEDASQASATAIPGTGRGRGTRSLEGSDRDEIAQPLGRARASLQPESDAGPSLESIRERSELLTPREREIAHLVTQGHSSKQVARALKLSKNTVNNYRTRILRKLELDNFVQVTRLLSTPTAEYWLRHS